MLFEPNQINEIFNGKSMIVAEIDNYIDDVITISKTKHTHYDIFIMVDSSNKTVSYFVIDKEKFVGSGCFGQVYQGFDVISKDQIVAKYEYISHIRSEEIKCLKKLVCILVI